MQAPGNTDGKQADDEAKELLRMLRAREQEGQPAHAHVQEGQPAHAHVQEGQPAHAHEQEGQPAHAHEQVQDVVMQMPVPKTPPTPYSPQGPPTKAPPATPYRRLMPPTGSSNQPPGLMPGLAQNDDPWNVFYEDENAFQKCYTPGCIKKERHRGYCKKPGWERQEQEDAAAAVAIAMPPPPPPRLVLSPRVPHCNYGSCGYPAEYRGYCTYHSWQVFPSS